MNLGIVDVAPLLDELNMGPLELERYVPPVQNERGGYDDQLPAIVVVNPVVHHTLNGRDLVRVPEADRTSELRTFYAPQRFFVADGGKGADVIRALGRRWRFVNVSDAETEDGVYFGDAALEDRS